MLGKDQKMGLFNKTPEEKEAAKEKRAEYWDSLKAETKAASEEHAAARAEKKADKIAAKAAWRERNEHLTQCPKYDCFYVSGFPSCKPGVEIKMYIDEENKLLSFVHDNNQEITLPFERIESIWGGTAKDMDKARHADHFTLGRFTAHKLGIFPEEKYNRNDPTFHMFITYSKDGEQKVLDFSNTKSGAGEKFVQKITEAVWGKGGSYEL